MINLRNRIGNVKLYTLCLMVALLLSGCGSSNAEIKEIIDEGGGKKDGPEETNTPSGPDIKVTITHEALIFSWRYPSDSGCDRLVLYQSDEPISPENAGKRIYNDTGLGHIKKGLINGTTYYYKANYVCSSGIHSGIHSDSYEFHAIPEDVVVVFPDRRFKSLVTKAANPDDGILNASDVMDIESITNAPNPRKSISNIEGIEYLINLKTLMLQNNEIVDITPLKNLTKLEALNLSENRIVDISVLENLTLLKELRIDANRFKDISVVSSLPNLELFSFSVIDTNFNLQFLVDLTFSDAFSFKTIIIYGKGFIDNWRNIIFHSKVGVFWG
ncbi:MAG: hypothetical protein HRT90_03675 [Candidatus Margulisbacteria bacterium]|nr:hypothetical protein [Candidatus Margulisiibacteriota bacterium]